MKYLLVFLASIVLVSCKTSYNDSKSNRSLIEMDNSHFYPADGEAIPLSTFPANYPQKAMLQKVEGYTKVAFDITMDGEPVNIEVVESVPSGVFDEVTMNAIKKWRFKPRSINGKPVASKGYLYTMNFELGHGF